jgi:hypothetical protein
VARPKLKIGDIAIVRDTIYESPLDRHVVFKLREKGVVKKITGDVVHLEVEETIKKINIYNLKKHRKYTKRAK